MAVTADPVAYRLEGVRFRHRGAAADAPDALAGVGPGGPTGLDLVVPAGAVFAVVGPGGAGKTTLLNLLGLMWEGPPTAGRVLYHPGPAADPVELGRLSASAAAALRLREFGFVLQRNYLLPNLTCQENVLLPQLLAGRDRAAAAARAAALLAWAEVDPNELGRAFLRRQEEVSGGQGQRVGIIRAVANDPRVLLLDEPLSQVDHFGARDQAVTMLREWQAGGLSQDGRAGPRTLVITGHDLDHMFALGTHFLLLDPSHPDHGRVLTRAEVGSPTRWKSRAAPGPGGRPTDTTGTEAGG